jgi:hypothetical protein
LHWKPPTKVKLQLQKFILLTFIIWKEPIEHMVKIQFMILSMTMTKHPFPHSSWTRSKSLIISSNCHHPHWINSEMGNSSRSDPKPQMQNYTKQGTVNISTTQRGLMPGRNHCYGIITRDLLSLRWTQTPLASHKSQTYIYKFW